jgi:CheY-like chemotaxis protein
MILRPVRSSSARSRPLKGVTQPYQWTHSTQNKECDLSQTPVPPMRKPGVLVVEGEGSVRTVLGLLLRQHGFAVWHAASAVEALAVQAQRPEAIDIALVDTLLPGLDSPALVQALRAVSEEVCCCFLSGRAGDFSAEQLQQLGVARLFPRPFQLAEMAKELQLVMAGEEVPPPTPEPRSLVIDVAEPPGDERRGTIRFRCELDNSCQPLGQSRSGEHWQGQILDISAGGARVLLNRRFEVGTVLVLSVTNPSGDGVQRLLARVVRLVREPDGQWSLGCSFTTPLDESDLRDLLA